jgi:hypothetical protein
MQLKFLKYWADIPLLYSFAFILDSRAKLRGFYKVLQLLHENTGSDYNMYYADVKTEIHKLFDKYERKFVAGRSQRVTQPSNQTVRGNRTRGESLEDQVLLVLSLPLPLEIFLLNLHAIWTVTVSHLMRMILTYFSSDVTTN